MTKRELVIRVSNKLGLTQSEVAKVIETTFDTISEALAESLPGDTIGALFVIDYVFRSLLSVRTLH